MNRQASGSSRPPTKAANLGDLRRAATNAPAARDTPTQIAPAQTGEIVDVLSNHFQFCSIEDFLLT